MNAKDAMGKLKEYAKCGLAHNGHDLKQLDQWVSVVNEAIASEPPNQEITVDAWEDTILKAMNEQIEKNKKLRHDY